MVLHVSISFHGHIWLLEANLFGEEKQHIFCKFGITPRCLAPESPSWELECEPPPRCQWGSCKPPWRGIQWVNAASVLTLRRLMQGYRYRVVPGSEGFAHPSGWGEARLSISNIFWVTYTVYIYILYIIIYIYNYIYISLRLRATKNGNVRQDFASNSLASGHDWSKKHQGDPLSQETMGIESEWSIKLRDGSELKLRAVLIGDNEIGTWKRLEDYEVANIMAIIHSTRQTMAICYS